MAATTEKPAYLTPARPLETRAADLASYLTLEETVAVQRSLSRRSTTWRVGATPGKESAKFYVCPPGPSVDQPPTELKGFAKVALAPLEEKFVRIDLDARAFAFYDPATGRCVAEPGACDLLIVGSAADIELQATLRPEAAD